MYLRRALRRAAVSLVVLTMLLTGLQLATFNTASLSAGSTVRINTGGPSATVNGTTWSGCSAINSCSGYVSGGFQWSEPPPPAVTGYPANTSLEMHQKEWTGGQTNGVAYGATAFSFNVPVASNNDYDVTLQFTELNKSTVGARVFDVNIDQTPQLTYFDIFQQAGGEFKTITRTFRVHDANGVINIDFIRRTENAKVDAIEIVPASTSGTTTTTTTTPAIGTNISWGNIANSPYRTVEGSGGIIGNKLYQFGGYQPNTGFYTPTRTASVYDIATNRWSYLPSVPQGITHAGRVIDGRRFILLGGVVQTASGGQSYSSAKVYTFNVDANQWTTLPDLPAARGSGGAALVNRELHFFGGVDASLNEKGDHWVLDLDNTSAGWKTAPAFPAPRSHFGAVVVNNNSIYSVGGMNGWEKSTVERRDTYRYDVVTKGWTRMADMPVVRSHIGEASMQIDGRIWMMGGEPKYPDATNEIYVYDIAVNKWTRAAAVLPAYRFAGIADHIGNTVFYVGGNFYEDGAWKGTIK